MSVVNGILLFAAGLGILGALVSALIAARLSVGRALLAYVLWLPLPFVGLAVLLGSGSDPSLPADRQSYNFWFGFVLISFLVAVPWSIGNLVGAIFGWRRSKRRLSQVADADRLAD
jgi:hypothetical protein